MLVSLTFGCGKKESENNKENNNSSNNGTNNKSGGYEYTYTDGVLTPIVDEDGNPRQT